MSQAFKTYFGVSLHELMSAYSDCNQYKGERNLNYFCETPLNGAELKIIFAELCPNGYNQFDSIKSVDAVIKAFGDSSEFYIAREGSPCIYVKPTEHNVWMDRLSIECDELMFCPEKQMFRVWWD